MDANAIATMFRQDRAEWEALVAILEAHPQQSLHDAASPPWTSRDVYAHLARWMDVTTAHLEARLKGHDFPRIPGTDDEINERWQSEDAGQSLAEARERAQTAFQRRVSAIQAVPVHRWDDVLEKIARGDGSKHYAAHRGYIVVA